MRRLKTEAETAAVRDQPRVGVEQFAWTMYRNSGVDWTLVRID
jgi:hypothetical protein